MRPRLERKEQAIGLNLGRAFLVEETANAKALRQDGDWLVPMNSEEAGVAKQSEQEGLVQAEPFWSPRLLF